LFGGKINIFQGEKNEKVLCMFLGWYWSQRWSFLCSGSETAQVVEVAADAPLKMSGLVEMVRVVGRSESLPVTEAEYATRMARPRPTGVSFSDI
jgi:hypothetical protein